MKSASFYSIVVVFVVTLGLLSDASAAVISGPVTNPANGHQYYLLSQNTWTNSEAEAVTLGGHLATINDLAENQFVSDNFATLGSLQRNLYIGFNDAAVEGTFAWVSGETPGYTKWRSGEPNNDEGGEDYAVIMPPVISTQALWNDVKDATTARHVVSGTFYPNHGVVEVIPEPASLALLVLGSLTLLRHRRT